MESLGEAKVSNRGRVEGEGREKLNNMKEKHVHRDHASAWPFVRELR